MNLFCSSFSFITNNAKATRLFFIIILASISVSTSFSSVMTSTQTGSWTAGSTWVGGVAPGASDDVVISSGHRVSLSNINTYVNNLTIRTGAVLDDNNKKLTINGYFIINGTFAGRRDLKFTGGSGTYLDGNGTINIVNFVKGLIIHNSTEIKSTANLVITYYVELKSNVVVTNNGKATIYNNLVGINSGSHWINASGSYLGLSELVMSTGLFTASASGNTVEYLQPGNQAIQTPSSSTYHNLIISGSNTKSMSDDLILNGDLTIISSKLDCNSYSLTIKGNWTNSNNFDERTGTVTFNGTGTQYISNIQREDFSRLIVNKSSGSIILAQGDVRVEDTLFFIAGTIDAGSFMFTLGSANNNPGVLIYTSGRVIGEFERYVVSTSITYLFPLGTQAYDRPMKLKVNNIRRSGRLMAEFVESPPGNSGLPVSDGGTTIYNTFVEGYWVIDNNGCRFRNINLECTGNGFATFSITSNTRLLTRTSSTGSWTAQGTHVSASGYTAKRNSLTSENSQYAFGDATNCSLPSTSTITGVTTVCKNTSTVAYFVTNTSGSHYHWTITGGTQASGDTSNSITVNYGPTGMLGNVTVREENNCGNGSPVSKDVAIEPIPPSYISGKEDVAKFTQDVPYMVASKPGYSYIWTYSGGQIDQGQGTNSITMDWDSTGLGSVGVYVSYGTCGIAPIVEKSINIYEIIDSEKTGRFDDTSTWVCRCIPTEFDNIRINTGHAVELRNHSEVKHLVIDPGGIFDAGARKKILTVNGNITVNGTYKGRDFDLILTGINTTIDGTGTIDMNNSNIVISEGSKTILATTVLSITRGDIKFTTSGIQIFNYGNVELTNSIVGLSDASNSWWNQISSIICVGDVLLASGTLVAWPSENTVEYCKNGTQTIKNPNLGKYYNLNLNGNNTKSLSASTIIEGSLLIHDTAQLDVTTSNFPLEIKGDWIDTGYNANAFVERNGMVTFSGTSNQTIIKGSSETFYNLTINKSSDTLIFNNNIAATNRVAMLQGIIKTGNYKLTLGTGTSNEGILVYTSGRVIGNFERWVATTATPYLFPIGSETYYRPAQPNFNNITTSGTLLASFVESQPGNNGLTLSDGGVSVTNTFRDGYWTFEVGNGFASSNYYLELVGNGFTDFIIEANTRLLARTNASSAWVANGTHVSASGNTTKRSGMTIFPAEYAFGDDTDCSLDAVWTGSTSTDWNTGSNWSTSVVPGRCTDVIINQTSIQPILNDDVSCNNLTINAKACLTINTLKTLLLEGYLTINSDSTGSGSLLDKGTLATSLPSRVIRYFKTNGGLYNYHYFSSPISDASSSQFIGAKVLYGFDEGNYQWTNLPATLPVGVGYIAHYVSDATVLFMGTLNTGSQTITSSYTNSPIRTLADEGWNLVGNPYPSAIDWETTSGWTRPNVDYTVYYRNGDQYATFNRSTSSSTNGGTRYIPPTTGFFVKCNEFYSNNSLTMNNDIRVSTIQGFYKPEQPDRKLKIKSEANGYSDEIVVLIRENSTPEYDGEYDGYKLYGSESKRAEIYTITPEGTELSINTIPLSEEYTVVPIGLWIGVSSEITLTGEDYNSFAGHVDIFLEDLYEDKLIDFRKDNIYKFDANPGSLTDRFRLHFLPILNPTVTYDDKVTPDGFQNVVSTDEQAGLENSVKIYSHKNNIYINITGPFLNNSVEIYDVLGKEIFRKHSLESNFEKITIENSGYYIVKVLTGENYYTKKVFIN